MDNSKKITLSFIIVCLVLFGVFIYPGILYFSKLGTIYSVVTFLGLASYLVYIYLELNKKYQHKSQSDEKSEDLHVEEERKFTDFFSNSADPNEKYHQLSKYLIKTVKQSLVSDSAFFYLYNDFENYFRLQHYETEFSIELTEIVQGNEFFDEFRKNCIPVIYDEVQMATLGNAHYPVRKEIKTLMLVPIFFNGFIGFIGVDSREKQAWGEHDLDLLKDYTNIITQFISQLDNMESLNRKIDFLREVEELNLSIDNEQDFMSVYRSYITLMEKYLSYDKLSIISWDSKGEADAQVEFIDGVETDYTVGHKFSIEKTVFEKVLNSDEFIIDNYQESDIIYRFKPNDLNVLPFKSAIGISMNISENIQTGLILESFNENNYSKTDYKLLSTICKNLEKSYKRNFEYKIVKDLSLIDSLTKVFNHKSLKDQLKNEIERCNRYSTKLSYLMIDIDKFKRINDEHGHLFGDYVLGKISQIIKASVRKIDVVGRYGGEEFGVILINTDKETSFLTAERIRSNIDNFSFEYDGKQSGVTISIGIAEFPDHGSDFHNIIANADHAMYQVKEMQGNKVIMYKA